MSKIKSLIPPIALLILILAAGSPAAQPDQLEQAQTLMNNGQYEQAKNIYQQVLAENPGNDEGLEAQKQIVIIHIATDNQAEADAAFDQLIAGFSQHKDIAKCIWQIARQYNSKGNIHKAIGLNQHNVDNYPNEKYAMWSQVEIIQSYIKDGNNAADTATDELINKFSDQQLLPKEIYLLARGFSEAGKKDRAAKLYKFDVEKFPSNKYGKWSKIYCHILDSEFDAAGIAVDSLIDELSSDPNLPKDIYHLTGAYNRAKRYDMSAQLYQYFLDKWPNAEQALNARKSLVNCYINLKDEQKAQESIDKLLADFADRDGIVKAVYELGQLYRKMDNYDKAIKLYQYAADNFSKGDMYTMWSQVEVVKYHIRDGNEPAAKAAYDNLISAFSNQPALPTSICQIGDTYCTAGNYDKADELHRYVLARWPQDKQLLWAKAGMISLDIARGDEVKANEAIDNLMIEYKDNPDLPEVIFQIGEQCWNMGMAEVKKANSGPDPNNEEASSNSGVLNDKAKDYFAKALDVWKKEYEQLPLSPYSKDAWYFSGVIYRRHLRDAAKGLAYYQKVVDDWPDYEYAWSAQAMIGLCYEQLVRAGLITKEEAEPKIEQAYKVVIEKYPDCSLAGHAYLKSAMMASKKNQWSEAAGYYETFLNNFPQDKRYISTLNRLGLTYEQMGHLEQAAQIYQLLVQQGSPLDRSYKRTVLKLARLASKKSQWSEAAEYYETFLNNFSDDEGYMVILYSLGRAYEQIGKLERAAQIYQLLVQQGNPADRSYKRTILKLARLASKKSQWDEAAGYYETFLNNFPEDKEYWLILYSLGRAYEQMSQLEQAAQIYQLLVQQGNSEDRYIQGSMTRLAGMKGGEK